jgi:hypothetical protein
MNTVRRDISPYGDTADRSQAGRHSNTSRGHHHRDTVRDTPLVHIARPRTVTET